MKDARRIIGREVSRRKVNHLTLAEKPADFFQWVEETANGEVFDPVIMQLRIAFAAIHTSTDLLVKVLIRLSEHPQLVADLRQEITTVHTTHGWTKSGLHHLKLLDSVLKEVQRLEPASFSKVP
jgi:hypothetical protein